MIGISAKTGGASQNESRPGEPLVDSSLPALLAHRGVPMRKIAGIILDLGHEGSLAREELDRLLPTNSRTREREGRIEFRAVLGDDVYWDGNSLEVWSSGRLPDTLVAALVGRPLTDVVDHPALPPRPITKVERFGDGIVLYVDPDGQPLGDVAPPSLACRLAGPFRRSIRRRAASIASGSHRGAGDGACAAILAALFSLPFALVPMEMTEALLGWNWDSTGPYLLSAIPLLSSIAAFTAMWSTPDSLKEGRWNDYRTKRHFEAASLAGCRYVA